MSPVYHKKVNSDFSRARFVIHIPASIVVKLEQTSGGFN
jgi:hypothetical protein